MADNRFYIYDLIDPRCGSVFYVGKGQRSRINAHESDAKRGVVSPKTDRIREIWAAGLSVKKKIVKRFSSESEALAAEVERIAEIGLENLTNIAPGGGGVRVKTEHDLALEQIDTLMFCVSQWAKHGRVTKINLGRHGVLDLSEIVASWTEKMAKLSPLIGKEASESIAKKHNVKIAWA